MRVYFFYVLVFSVFDRFPDFYKGHEVRMRVQKLKES